MHLENAAASLPLAPKTSLGIGGPARYFALPTTRAALRETLTEAHARALPVFVLGGGSNLVIADTGWPGLVVTPALTQRTGARVGAGYDWNRFVDACAAENLAGVECLAGIPGSVGATPIQNVGAYGQEVAETIVAVTALDRTTLEERTFTNAECGFDYRTSRFNTHDLGRWLIVEVEFALRAGGAPTLRYRDLAQHFGPGSHPGLTDVVAAVRQIRAQKGMVLDPADPESRSAGSFFKNPIVSLADAARLPENAPRYPQADTTVKLSAAWLIEQAGIHRGQALQGGVRVSAKHVLALVNRGDATAADVVESARQVQARVQARWGVLLHPEPLFVGFDPATDLPQGATRIEAVP